MLPPSPRLLLLPLGRQLTLLLPSDIWPGLERHDLLLLIRTVLHDPIPTLLFCQKLLTLRQTKVGGRTGRRRRRSWTKLSPKCPEQSTHKNLKKRKERAAERQRSLFRHLHATWSSQEHLQCLAALCCPKPKRTGSSVHNI